MKSIYLGLLFLCLAITSKCQYNYIGHNGGDCTDELTITYTYENYSQGSHGHGYYIRRDGQIIRSRFDEFGGYYVKDLQFLNDSIGFFC